MERKGAGSDGKSLPAVSNGTSNINWTEKGITIAAACAGEPSKDFAQCP